MSKRILVFAREAGGVAAIAPVCRKLISQDFKLLLLSKDHGIEHFLRFGLSPFSFPDFSVVHLEKLIRCNLGLLPDVIFTSASSLPTLDMTERYLWKWALDNRISSVGLLDQWQNYAIRFSGVGDDERLTYLPDYIFVMDSFARQEMVAEGIPEEKIVITGQPAFEDILYEYQKVCQREMEIINSIGLSAKSCKVLFVAEALRVAYGDTLGYDEQSVLIIIGDELDMICRLNKNISIDLIVKLHPENDLKDFNWIFSQWPTIGKHLVSTELSSLESIAIADLVTGMTSILMLESILVNKPTISFQICSMVESQLIATKIGAIPFLVQEEDARRTLTRILIDSSFKARYLARQQKFKFVPKGAENCLRNLQRI